MIAATQILLPLALIAWIVMSPAASRIGLSAQVVGVGLFLFGLALAAMWLQPPWWLPWLFTASWGLAVLTLTGRLPMDLWPAGPLAWSAAAFGFLLAAVGVWGTAIALAARNLPSEPIAKIANPLGPGQYLVVQGGSRPLLNGHLKTLDTSVPRFRDWRGQSYAIDLIGIGAYGLRAAGWRPRDPAAYTIYGVHALAPCDGRTVQVENGLPDLPVPEIDRVNRAGNHVLLDCGDFHVLLAHMQQGSIEVRPGETVDRGAILGKVGNSGSTGEPHLHVHAQRPGLPDAPFAGDPIPLLIEGRYLVRNDRLRGANLKRIVYDPER